MPCTSSPTAADVERLVREMPHAEYLKLLARLPELTRELSPDDWLAPSRAVDSYVAEVKDVIHLCEPIVRAARDRKGAGRKVDHGRRRVLALMVALRELGYAWKTIRARYNQVAKNRPDLKLDTYTSDRSFITVIGRER